MEPGFEEVDVHAPSKGQEWHSSEGIGNRGQGVVINYIVKDEGEIPALAHGLGIAHNVHMHKPAERIGNKEDFDDLSGHHQ